MISPKAFMELDIINKKMYLLSIFSQLPQDMQEIHNVIGLLELDIPYHEHTLDTIFINIKETIEEGKIVHDKQLEKQAYRAHFLLQQEAKESANEADAILDGI